MLDHWETHGPPVYVAVASYLGLNKKKSSKKIASSNLDELEKMLSGSGGNI